MRRIKDSKIRWCFGNIGKIIRSEKLDEEMKVKKVIRVVSWLMREKGVEIEFEEVKE